VAKLALAEATAGGDVEVVASIDAKGETKVTLTDLKSNKSARAVIPVA